ncbi:MAG: FHA domain-containing protein [Desulfofustis sp.]|nr:FHA domain-containing protein [Desulfofustis sp.]
MPVITLKYKDTVLGRYQVGIGQTLTIGRNDSNDIVIDNLAVSANHARIESVSASFIIKDLQSTNGTFVNEKLVSAHGLRNNDVILIGKHTLLFDRSDLDQQPTPDDNEDLDEKTRYLDTAEYRELIEKAKKDPKDGPSYVGTAVSRDYSGGFFTRIWRRLFG